MKSLNSFFIGMLLFLSFNLVRGFESKSSEADKVVIIIIDGARYSETFGDTQHNYIPKMWELSKKGTIVDNFYNDSLTYTSRAIPALWSGTWTEVRDTVFQNNATRYSVKPSIFEYYRKDKSQPKEEAIYVLKYIKSLWLPSFDASYGPEYWPLFHSVGSTDSDVANEALSVMEERHPHLLWIYLADVDHAGHSGNWDNYTNAIQIADSIVSIIWEKIETDSFYQNSTTLFVTNDHGRHDDQHGGFTGHGDGCLGCRHIQFLAVGPNIKQNYVSTKSRRIPDMVATASTVLGIDARKSTGANMSELFTATSANLLTESIVNFSLEQNYPNPFNPTTTIKYSIPVENHNGELSHVSLKIYDTLGKEVATLVNKKEAPGSYSVNFDAASLSSGIYFYKIRSGSFVKTKKMSLIK